ncbi:PDDEXK nuclease domain-containing protein [Rhodococcoides yunnanense]|uniref:PDDEXK nuclease domain-containing protein n=1 Tax=Rhodococcoides yunnanense TaxID=278209 RepID=UPI0022B13F46|nr:PDDEXK nuclease domain-containing protein [Rhodococcus yunnanensis]MCZ4277826.1 PDDEXK nuclease domain-containing protein [Rhodococcus yunnanensis]
MSIGFATSSIDVSGRHHRTSTTIELNDQLPADDSELANQLVRDPYVFDFLDLTDRVAERELEDALVTRMERFLLELGHGFAFVGRQYHFAVDGDDFNIDLLFFNWMQSRFVVIELEIGRFQPEYLGKLGFYVAWAANVQESVPSDGELASALDLDGVGAEVPSDERS